MLHCRHCGAEIRTDRLPVSECLYWDQLEYERRRQNMPEDEVTEPRRSGADAPCYGESFSYFSDKHTRNQWKVFLGICVVVFILGIVFVWGR